MENRKLKLWTHDIIQIKSEINTPGFTLKHYSNMFKYKHSYRKPCIQCIISQFWFIALVICINNPYHSPRRFKNHWLPIRVACTRFNQDSELETTMNIFSRLVDLARKQAIFSNLKVKWYSPYKSPSESLISSFRK